jgi:hypothetical protein
VCGLLTLLLLCGCSKSSGFVVSSADAQGFSNNASPQVSDGPYRDQIVAWRDGLANRHDPGAEFVKKVLADGVITAEEIGESAALQVQCLQDAGYQPNTFRDEEIGVPQVVWKNNPRPDEEWPSDADACVTRWDGGLLSMYRLMQRMPNGEPTDNEVAACLVHEGLVPEGFTGRDLAEIAAQTIITQTSAPGDNSEAVFTAPANPADPILPGGHRYLSEEVQPCLLNPKQVMNN